MSSTNGYQVKVYYIENQATKEIRKFTIETEVASNFEYLGAKIRQVFPSLLRKDFEVYWKDTDSDYLTISSNDELICAWDSIFESNGCLKLFVKVKRKDQQRQATNNGEVKEHPGIICDGCESKIQGIRFKCTSCFDFDLCSSCETKNIHPANHELLCIKSPREFGGRPRHPRFGHGCHQHGPFGPWRGPGGPRRGTGMFCRSPPFGGFAYSCGPAQRKRCGEEEKEPNAKRSCSQNSADEKSIGEAVGNLAGCFGLDPEVAKCYFVSFSDDLKEHCKENKQQNSEKPAEEKPISEQREEDFASNLASAFGLQEEFVRHFLNPFLPSENETQAESSQPKGEESKSTYTDETDKTNEGEKVAESSPTEMETDVEHSVDEKVDEQNVDFKVADEEEKQKSEEEKQESEESESQEEKKTDQKSTPVSSSETSKPNGENGEFRQELESMVKHFSEQFSIPNENQQNIQGGLESLLQGMFNFQRPNQPSRSNSENNEDEPRKPDDFVFVDETNQEQQPQLTEEERYQKNLNEALDKMLAMGFDNDGGWLSQLLVSKDLSIDRVLEALSPSR